MYYTFYELLSFFFIYSFLGWCMEVIYATIRKRKFVNRGLLVGILCPAYGVTMVGLLVFFESLKEDYIYLVLACFIITSVSEALTGNLLEKMFGRKCWDYSKYKFHIGNYVCLQFSLLWTVEAVVVIYFLHPIVHWLVAILPVLLGQIVLYVLSSLLILDMIITVTAILKMKGESKQLQEIEKGIRRISCTLSNTITKGIQRRMTKVYPKLADSDEDLEQTRKDTIAKKTIFAYGCSFYKLVWLFILGAFLGDIIETIFCFFTMGTFVSRSSVIYGQFSVVWGLGIVLMTMLLNRYRNRDDRYLFLSGTILGGVYEYICSVFTEIAFGTIFWDYSEIPFNIGGRINLLYCFFWGIAALIWFKGVYPFLSKQIEKIPMRTGKILSWCIIIFMVVNITISGAALIRYTERDGGVVAENSIDEFLDRNYDDVRMKRIYPKAVIK